MFTIYYREASCSARFYARLCLPTGDLMCKNTLKVMKNGRQQVGTFGERVAAAFLRERGYEIIHANWRQHPYEIDLICREGPVCVFIEVRTRRADALVAGYFTVRGQKKQALKNAFNAYLRAAKNTIRHYRFDVVEVRVGANGDPIVNHYENIPIF